MLVVVSDVKKKQTSQIYLCFMDLFFVMGCMIVFSLALTYMPSISSALITSVGSV